MARRLVIAVAMMTLGAVFAVPAAQAEFGIAKFEGLTCKTDLSTPGVGNWEDNGDPCLASGEVERFYTQAAGHPDFGITAFLMNQVTGPPPLPDGFIKEIRTELPEGLGVNPEATPQCTRKQLGEIVSAPPVVTKCATEVPASQVGINYLTTISSGPPAFPVPAGTEFTVPIPVYNLEPEPGEPSSAGFNATGEPTILESDLNPKDQHISFTVRNLKSPLAGGAPVIGSRLVFKGQAGTGYLTMPSNCAGPQVTSFHVKSHPNPPPEGPELTDEETFPTAVGADGCENVPFKAGLDVTSSGATDSPEPVTVGLTLPFDPDPSKTQTSYLRTAKVVLPDGVGINPSLANGLVACTDTEFAKDTNTPIACPDASKIGTVDVKSPALPESIGGTVYVGQPTSNDPSSGNQFRIFIHVSSAKFGVNVRLIGNVFPNLQTGQLTAVVDENPQAPFESFEVHLDGGARGALTSPGTCGPHTTTTEMTPWSGHIEESPPTSSFTLTSLPGGGSCPNTLAGRPFAPAFQVKSDNTQAGAYSPFRVQIARTDGQQELKAVNVTLPKGLTGKLAGIPYCPEADIAAAAASSGTASWPATAARTDSMIGTTTTAAGSGSGPLELAGKAFLAGPYKGAPLSMAVVTPAVAGPYDIGTVVVRVALNVNPETAQVNAVSDLIPDVFGGVKLDIRSIDVNVDRSKFMLNPTNCAAQATSGAINGGGADPSNPAVFSSYAVSDPYAATGCDSLGFKPKLHVRLSGPTKRAKNPRLRAILEAREGDANLSRTALTLPHALFLDQGHIQTVCTRPQLASQTCPTAAVYGHAEAVTPLLSDRLKGPVYLVSSSHNLPDLVADLHGQVNIQLHGVIGTKHGGLKTVFNPLPDVPVKKFILNMQGGKKSLLVNSTNTCQKKQTAVLNIKAQNGKKVKSNKFRLNMSSCGKKGKKK